MWIAVHQSHAARSVALPAATRRAEGAGRGFSLAQGGGGWGGERRARCCCALRAPRASSRQPRGVRARRRRCARARAPLAPRRPRRRRGAHRPGPATSSSPRPTRAPSSSSTVRTRRKRASGTSASFYSSTLSRRLGTYLRAVAPLGQVYFVLGPIGYATVAIPNPWKTCQAAKASTQSVLTVVCGGGWASAPRCAAVCASAPRGWRPLALPAPMTATDPRPRLLNLRSVRRSGPGTWVFLVRPRRAMATRCLLRLRRVCGA